MSVLNDREDQLNMSVLNDREDQLNMSVLNDREDQLNMSVLNDREDQLNMSVLNDRKDQLNMLNMEYIYLDMTGTTHLCDRNNVSKCIFRHDQYFTRLTCIRLCWT